MAGVLEHIRRSRRKPVRDYVSSAEIDPKTLELAAAKEILAEVFGTDISEIDEMLKLRCAERLELHGSYSRKRRARGEPLLKHRSNEMQVWPMEFCLAQ